MNIHQLPLADFKLNQLNRLNGFKGSQSVELEIAGSRFRVGFWETIANNTPTPLLALIVWTPEGWKVVGRAGMIYGNDLAMETGSAAEDLKQYMWWAGKELTPYLTAYLESLGSLDEATGVEDADESGTLEEWEKVLHLLATVRFENNELLFDQEI